MLTTEQYRKIMKERVMPIVNACITTKDNPNAATFCGQTNSTRNQLFSFDKTKVPQYKDDLIEVFKDLPRHEGGSVYGYVPFTDLFSDTTDPKRKAWELRLANAFMGLSEIAEVAFLSPVHSTDGVLSGANLCLNQYIPTREEEERRERLRKQSAERWKNQPR